MTYREKMLNYLCGLGNMPTLQELEMEQLQYDL